MFFRAWCHHSLCRASFLLVVACGMEAHGSSNSPTGSEASYHLDRNNTSVTQPIGPGLRDPEKQKFLEIVVIAVLNPKKLPLLFEVHYQGDDQKKVFLGTFSLFPPDQPGTFIVATRGQLRSAGVLVLSMVVPAGIPANDAIRVTLERIRFREE
ncbi:MAG: hypothetical protein HOP18_25160 [Deltaproteobacteria bacterium]|nr:hypothetical protein [Deltaproteobacteria bacterium]